MHFNFKAIWISICTSSSTEMALGDDVKKINKLTLEKNLCNNIFVHNFMGKDSCHKEIKAKCHYCKLNFVFLGSK